VDLAQVYGVGNKAGEAVTGMTVGGAWFLWSIGLVLLSSALFVTEEEEKLNNWRKQNNLPYGKPSRWLKPIIAVWCAWTLPPFVAAWLRLMLS
jgi:hypothetical protein